MRLVWFVFATTTVHCIYRISYIRDVLAFKSREDFWFNRLRWSSGLCLIPILPASRCSNKIYHAILAQQKAVQAFMADCELNYFRSLCNGHFIPLSTGTRLFLTKSSGFSCKIKLIGTFNNKIKLYTYSASRFKCYAYNKSLCKWGHFEKAKTTFKMLLAIWFLVCSFKRFTSFVA